MTNSADIYFPVGETEKHFIISIWRLCEFNIHERTETILPKGTVEIIFNLSEDIIYSNDTLEVKKILPSCFINGINFKPFKLLKKGQLVFLGIQLNALGLKILFNISSKEFNNNVVEGSEICQSLNSLSNQLFTKKTFKEQVETIMNWIYRRISVSNSIKSLHQIHHLFYSQKLKDLTVSKLCHEVHFSDRQLRRLSTEWLGMNTETFILYNKYLSALKLLHTSDLSLTQIGLDAGYYNQSHFIREFKSYTNLTPKEYKASISDLPGHIIR